MSIDRVSSGTLPNYYHVVTPTEASQNPGYACIQALHAEKKTNCPMATMVANMLDRLLIPSLTSEYIIYELLQNADDAPGSESLDVQIRLQGDWLLFSHSGRDFTEDDVKSISNAAQSTKTDDINLIGSKGVGFKSVFSVSSCIYVLTPTYRFCFNKDFEDWKEQKPNDKQKYPWQIIPIPVSEEDIPSDIGYQNDTRITFALKLSSDHKLHECQDHIKKLIDNPSVLAFLNNVNKVTIDNGNVSTSLVRENQQWTVGDISWSLHQMALDVPESVERDSILPDKYKSATSLTLTFALCHEKEKLVKAAACPLFSFLPTDEEIGLPYYVNAAFMLDNSRTKLHQDAKAWNGFLLESIAYKQFELFCEIGSPPEIGALITHPNHIVVSHHKKLFQEAFKRGFDRGMQTVAFIPSAQNGRLLMQEAIFDPYGFIELFGTDEEKMKRVHSGFVLPPECEKEYPCFARYDFEKIAATIVERQELFCEPEKAVQLMQFLYQHRHMLPVGFKTLPLFLSHTGLMQTGPELCLTYAAIGYSFPQLNSRLLHEQVYNTVTNEMRAWLGEFFGLKPVVLKTLLQDINENGLGRECVDIVVCAFHLYKAGHLTSDDLPEMQIKTRNDYRRPSQCYLRSCYKPEISLDGVISLEYLVSRDYFEKAGSEDIGEFLVKLGVNRSLSPDFIKDVSFTTDEVALTRFLSDLYNLWQKNPEKIAACDFRSKMFLPTNQGMHLVMNTYLPDLLCPQEPLEQVCASVLPIVIIPLHQHSNKTTIFSWKRFLSDLGVGQLVDFTFIGSVDAVMCLDGCKREGSKDMVAIKKDTIYTDFLRYSSDFPRYWNGWEEWKLTGFFHIPFHEAIKKTAILWTKIKENWLEIALSLQKFKKTDIARRDLTPLDFYLRDAVPVAGGEFKSPRDCLNPNLNQMLTGTSLPRAVFSCTFTDEQYKQMGFQEKLSAKDALIVLEALAKRSDVHIAKMKEWVSLLYRWILSDQYLFASENDIVERHSAVKNGYNSYVRNQARETLKQDQTRREETQKAFRSYQGPVFTEQGTFIPLEASCYQISDGEISPHSLWRPQEIAPDAFRKLCSRLSLTEVAPPVVLTNEVVGRMAEESVYEYLKGKYGPEVQESDSGFTAGKVTVIWHQLFSERLQGQGKIKQAEIQKYYECDFTLLRDGKKEKRIEVKASRFADGVDGIFSSRELSVMKRGEVGEIAYRVIHIRNIGSRDKAQYRWKKIKNITNVVTNISAFTSAQGPLAVTFKDVKISFSKVEDWQKPLQDQKKLELTTQ